MRRPLDDLLLAAGPLAATLGAAAHPLVGLAMAAMTAVLAVRALRSRRRRPRGPVIALAPLAPRRKMPRPEVSVGAILGESRAGVRALTAGQLTPGAVRVGAGGARRLDAPLVTACWSVATRANARLTDAAAVRLGLADAALPPVAAADPDPLLLAAISR
jgi:hypothetical protein